MSPLLCAHTCQDLLGDHGDVATTRTLLFADFDATIGRRPLTEGYLFLWRCSLIGRSPSTLNRLCEVAPSFDRLFRLGYKRAGANSRMTQFR